MRALALLLLLAPVAHAQPPVPLATLTAEDPPLVQPLQGPATANLTLHVSCALVDERGSVPISYAVEAAPPWATVVVSPAMDAVQPTACEAGTAKREATLLVTANEKAPAFRPSPVEVKATVGPPGRQEEARATVNVTADYFSILDVALAESSKVAPPDAVVPFHVKLTNLGNARTRVTMEVQETTGGLTVEPLAPLVLQSRQQGEPVTSIDANVVVHTPEGGFFVHHVGTVTVRVLAEHADDPPRPGDQATLSFIVTTQSGSGDQRAPLPTLVALAALALASAGKRRLRG